MQQCIGELESKRMKDPNSIKFFVESVTESKGQICDLKLLAQEINLMFSTNITEEDLQMYMCLDEDTKLIVDNAKIYYT